MNNDLKDKNVKQWDGKRKDPGTGKWYYYNKKTRETMWEDEAIQQDLQPNMANDKRRL